jgi:predicted cupin superfamily sugar epimerase
MYTSEYWIEKLQLTPHPEGGFYKEIYSSNNYFDVSYLTGSAEGKRSLATSIYFLLKTGEVSKFHRLRSDEIWYYHYGSSITIHCIDLMGVLEDILLGSNTDNGEVFQAVIPAGTIFGASVNDSSSYSLVSCMVSPGFNFDDFELMGREDLLSMFPDLKEKIMKFT